MTLSHTTRVVSIAVLLLVLAFFGGNQRQANALTGDEIADSVFCQLNGNGNPTDIFENVGDCPPSSPSPSPSPSPTPTPSPSPNPPGLPSQCSDGIDNDNDGKTDFVPVLGDPGCDNIFDDNEGDDPTTPPPPPPPPPPPGGSTPACADGSDNDGDGKVDMADPGCENASDTDETDPASPPSGGGSHGGSGGGGSSGSAGKVLGEATESCDQYIHTFIREGAKNDVEQVKRLQRFLRDMEGNSALQETGVYDKGTLAAVHAFQTKYASEILTPWGKKESTGYVYLTTRKKINEIYCKNTRQFPLTVDELKIMVEKLKAAQAALAGMAAPKAVVRASAAKPKPTVTPAAKKPQDDKKTNDTVTEPATEQSGGEVRTSLWDRIKNLFRGR